MTVKYFITFFILTSLLCGPVSAKNENNRQLPPGLQKKAAKDKPLPPGWQKKLAKGDILDKQAYRRSETVVPVDSRGLVTIRIEGKLLRLYEATREIKAILKD